MERKLNFLGVRNSYTDAIRNDNEDKNFYLINKLPVQK